MSEEPEPKKSRLMPIGIAVGAVITLIAVTAVGIAMSGTKTPEQNSGPTYAATLDVIIDIRDFGYFPREVSVPNGATVSWINYDNELHTATESAGDPDWDTQVIRKDDYASITFTAPGTYKYYCTLHAYMRGKLTVREAE